MFLPHDATQSVVILSPFYRTMLCKARLWDCMSSVRLSVCNDHVPWSHRLGFFENNFTAE